MNEWKQPAFVKAFPDGCIRVCEGNESGAYEGWGTGIAFNPATGKFLVAEYSHCSCHGPEDVMCDPSEYDCLVEALRGKSDEDRVRPLVREPTSTSRLRSVQISFLYVDPRKLPSCCRHGDRSPSQRDGTFRRNPSTAPPCAAR